MEEFKTILELHKKWLKNEPDGKCARIVDADLSNADLRGVNLRAADLRYSKLSGADLSNADLSNADLRYSKLSGADLSNADLSNADLRGADLRVAILHNADLGNADLKGANLGYADLREAVLHNAYLNNADLRDAGFYNADLSNADLRGADLRYSNLSGANLRGTMNVECAIACPEVGAFVGWKKAHGYIVKLLITKKAKRSSATSRKCRCNEALVLSIENIDGGISDLNAVASDYDYNFVYRVGEVVRVENFNDDRWTECAEGIHFFITREEAVNY